MSKRDELRDICFDILDQHPEGLRWMDLLRAVKAIKPDVGHNFHTSIYDLYRREAEVFYKPEKGLWKLVKYRDIEAESVTPVEPRREGTRILEEAFYEPFASFLESDLEDVTKAIPLGGNKFRDKWGTPDVIGKNESNRSDIIMRTTEIVSAEIKTDTNQLITAFGQACAYCIFSHKSYLVVPQNSSEEDRGRLDALCQVFGIGLVFFDAGNPESPNFQVRVRPKRYEPDLYYTNKYLKLIEEELFK